MTRRTAAPDTRRALRSDCPIAATLDLIGDRWTLLVIRDLVAGKRRFSEFLASDEGVETNTLAERLKRLERAGVVERSAYQEHPPRYEYHLSPAGRDLAPVLRAMLMWGLAHVPGTRKPTWRKPV